MASAARRGISLLAIAAAAFAANLVAMPTALAAGATPHHVGIVIDGDGVACVQWHSGITGDKILNEVARVVYRSDGVIVQIDGRPKSGTADDTHYWSYWHDTGSSWHYSNVGASSYHPKAGEVEGWVYDDGHQNAPPPAEKPSGLYNSLCGNKDSSQPSPSPSRSARPSSSAAPSRTSSAPAAHHARSPRRRAVAPSRTAAPRVTPAAGDPASGKARAPRRAASTRQSAAITSGRPSSRPSTADATTGTSAGRSVAARAMSTPSTSASPTSLPTLQAQPVAGGSDHGSPTPTLIAIAVIAVLMAGGGWLVLRRRRVR